MHELFPLISLPCLNSYASLLLKVKYGLSGYFLLGLLKDDYFIAFSRVWFPTLCWYFSPLPWCDSKKASERSVRQELQGSTERNFRSLKMDRSPMLMD